jgi:glycosyltransferase involved in cell wall biosynthesis
MVAAVAKVRDEADVIEPIVRQMATQVDFVLVADHGSEDGTREILESLSRELPLSVTDDRTPGHYQDRTLTALAKEAAERGAEWVLPFDGDEWHYSPHGRIADVLMERPEAIAIATTYDHVPSGEDDLDQADPTLRIGWRERDPFPMPKVACRTLPGLMILIGSHSAWYGHPVDSVDGLLEIRHFKYRSAEQFVRKIRNGAEAIAMTDFPPQICDHWRKYGAILEGGGPPALERIFRERHYREDPRAEVVIEGETRLSLLFDPVRAGL